MKKIVIGSVLMSIGTIISLSVIVLAALYVPKITEWQGTKLWFAIFGGIGLGNTSQSLGLGLPFMTGLVFLAIGFIILMKEYFKPEL